MEGSRRLITLIPAGDSPEKMLVVPTIICGSQALSNDYSPLLYRSYHRPQQDRALLSSASAFHSPLHTVLLHCTGQLVNVDPCQAIPHRDIRHTMTQFAADPDRFSLTESKHTTVISPHHVTSDGRLSSRRAALTSLGQDPQRQLVHLSLALVSVTVCARALG